MNFKTLQGSKQQDNTNSKKRKLENSVSGTSAKNNTKTSNDNDDNVINSDSELDSTLPFF